MSEKKEEKEKTPNEVGKEKTKSNALIIVIALIFLAGVIFSAYKINSEKKVEVGSKRTSVSRAPETRTISINEAGVFNFELQPLESLENWWYVEEGLNYRFSSVREDNSFFVKYKRGDLVKVGGSKIKLPNKAGPFKLMAGEQEVKITLLVSRTI